MLILIAGLVFGLVGIAFGIALLCVLKGKRRLVAILPFCFGLACLAGVGILILALQSFGMAPRDGNETVEIIEQSVGRETE